MNGSSYDSEEDSPDVLKGYGKKRTTQDPAAVNESKAPIRSFVPNNSEYWHIQATLIFLLSGETSTCALIRNTVCTWDEPD